MEITDNILDLPAQTHTLTKSIVDVNFGLQSRRQQGNGEAAPARSWSVSISVCRLRLPDAPRDVRHHLVQQSQAVPIAR
jgi:hypothetical protein